MIIFNYYFELQPPDTFKKVANCVNFKINLKQSNFERNAKMILGFGHFSSEIRDIEKHCFLNISRTKQGKYIFLLWQSILFPILNFFTKNAFQTIFNNSKVILLHNCPFCYFLSFCLQIISINPI